MGSGSCWTTHPNSRPMSLCRGTRISTIHCLDERASLGRIILYRIAPLPLSLGIRTLSGTCVSPSVVIFSPHSIGIELPYLENTSQPDERGAPAPAPERSSSCDQKAQTLQLKRGSQTSLQDSDD